MSVSGVVALVIDVDVVVVGLCEVHSRYTPAKRAEQQAATRLRTGREEGEKVYTKI